MEDANIVALFLKRDEAALAHTREKYGARLRRLAQDITQDAMTAEECENDTYLRAWNAIPPHKPVDYLYAFLARITRHVALDVCRSRSRLKREALLVELSAELEACIPAPGDTESRLEGEQLCAVVSAFLHTLPEKKRNVFVRRYWYMDSVAAIASRYGMSASAVKTLLFRTRNELRLFLEKEGYEL